MIKELMDRRERRIMDVLWSHKGALSVADLEVIFEGEKMSKVSIFKALSSLLKKEYVKVAGTEQSGTVYARTYVSDISKEEYAAVLLASSGIRSDSLGPLVLAMIGNDREDCPDAVKDKELIAELEAVIERVRKRDV